MQETEQKHRVRKSEYTSLCYDIFHRVPELEGFIISGRATESEHQIWNESVYVKYTAEGSKNGTGADIKFNESTVGWR